MLTQSPLGKRLLRTAVSLVGLGCLIAGGTISSKAEVSESTVVPTKAGMGARVATPDCCESPYAIPDSSDLLVTAQREIGLPDEFGIAVEDDDPIEMFRVDFGQRLFGIDHIVTGPTVAAHTARNIRSSISSPLLV